MLLNVLGYYDPLRELVRNGVRQGFIQPENESLIVYVDGPSDESEHAGFDWGTAALEAIDSWKKNNNKVVFNYDWTKRPSPESSMDKLHSS